MNSLRFHPNKELVITASGDGTVHIWQCAVHLYNESSSGRVASSEDELDPSPSANSAASSHHHSHSHSHHSHSHSISNEKELFGGFNSSGMDEDNQFSVLRTPLRSLNGHTSVAIAADWLPGGEQAVTAGKNYTYT